MAGATIWKGYIHFGDMDVAVKLHAAVREERIQFHLLHSRDHVRLRQQMVCAYEKRPVPAGEQSRGFEVDDGKYVIIDPEEIEKAAPEGSRIIEIHEFVRTVQIDSIFLDRLYYLAPDTHVKGYNSLVETLNELDVAGICTWIMRKRYYLGALQARGKMLRLHTLHYADEVVPVGSLELQGAPFSEKELRIGSELIEKLTVPFEPWKFENEHQKRLKEMIEKKSHGERIAVQTPRRLKPTESSRLLQALEESLKEAAGGRMEE